MEQSEGQKKLAGGKSSLTAAKSKEVEVTSKKDSEKEGKVRDTGGMALSRCCHATKLSQESQTKTAWGVR